MRATPAGRAARTDRGIAGAAELRAGLRRVVLPSRGAGAAASSGAGLAKASVPRSAGYRADRVLSDTVVSRHALLAAVLFFSSTPQRGRGRRRCVMFVVAERDII